MFPLLVVGGAYFTWCLIKEKRARRDARRIFEETPEQENTGAGPENKTNGSES